MVFQCEDQAPKKGINIKNFARNSPLDPSPPKRDPDPVNSLCLGAPFPSKYRKKPKHKEFFWGVLGGPKFFMLKFFMCFYLRLRRSGQVRPRQGTEICNFGAVSTGGSPLDFLLFLQDLCSKTSPLKSGESSEKSGGENRVKSCHVCGCHGFFGPEKRGRVLAVSFQNLKCNNFRLTGTELHCQEL